jgi:hypothetical protein
MSRSCISSAPQAPPWRVAGLLYLVLSMLLVGCWVQYLSCVSLLCSSHVVCVREVCDMSPIRRISHTVILSLLSDELLTITNVTCTSGCKRHLVAQKSGRKRGRQLCCRWKNIFRLEIFHRFLFYERFESEMYVAKIIWYCRFALNIIRFKHLIILTIVRFQVVTAASMKFRFAFWDVLPCKVINNNNNYYYFTRQYIPEDKSEQSIPLFTSKSPLCIIAVMCLISPRIFTLHEALIFLQTAFWISVIPTWRSKKYLGFLYIYLYLMFITWPSP